MNISNKEFENLELPTDEELRHETKREKLSIANKGKTASPELREKLSKIRKGHSTSDETRKKISESQKGKIISDESRQKMSESQKGHIVSNETRKKNSLHSSSMSEASKQKRAASRSRSVIITPKGEFNSRREVIQAYPELTRSMVDNWSKVGLHGFSKRLK